MISSTVIVFVLLECAASATVRQNEGCSIDLNRDLPKANEPLYLKKTNSTYELTVPTIKNRKGVIELNSNEEIVLACPGKNNYLVETKKPLTSGFCVRNTTLSTDTNSKKAFTIQDASCATAVETSVKVTNTRCSQVGKIYELGFEAYGWHVEISVCHDPSTCTSYYAKHTLKGEVIEGAERESRRPTFQKGGLKELYNGFNPENFYRKKAQGNLFKTLLGNSKVKSYYTENGEFFFSRGHLAPDADFVFGSEQFATYFYVNVAPQWQVINSGNWLSVEKMVRQHAKNTKEELNIVTGTYGILELEDDKGKMQKIYLNYQKKNIPVPAYYWKVVHSPSSKQSIAFVTSNNPYVKAGSKISFCSSPCIDYNWQWFDSKKEFLNVTRGITSCCALHDLRKEVSEVPFFDVQGVIRGSFSNRGSH